jgi:hypothetical protein
MTESTFFLLTVSDTTKQLLSGRTSVWNMIRSYALPSVRSRQSVCVSMAVLHVWIARHEHQQKVG